MSEPLPPPERTIAEPTPAPEPTPAVEAAPAPAAAPAADAAAIARDNADVRERMRRQTRRSFLAAGAIAAAAAAGATWLAARPEDGSLPWPLRRGLRLDEAVTRALYRPSRLTADLRGRAVVDRVNGDLGLDEDIDAASWRLHVDGLAVGSARLTLADLARLPRVTLTNEFHCIEGWSVVVSWAGVRFRDFVAAYPPASVSGRLPSYAGLATPDGDYYVGMDMPSLLHPQTLLATDMNGAPLTEEHGAPLRLVVPVKYGVKSIKRIGAIRYTQHRPADYWAEQGYDWYLGL